MAAAQIAAPVVLTEEELRSVWKTMRQRRSLRHWPATFEDAMADDLRAKCIAIEATAARQRQRRQCNAPVFIGADLAKRPNQTAWHWMPTKPANAGAIDLKRAAAGDRDD